MYIQALNQTVGSLSLFCLGRRWLIYKKSDSYPVLPFRGARGVL